MAEYLIPVGQKDVNRMDAMCLVFNPLSLDLLCRYSAKSFLDVGCGHGNLTKAYAQTHPDVECIGIDCSEEQVDLAQQNLPPNLQIELGDALNINLKDELGQPRQFDIVHTRFVLIHVQDPVKVAQHLLTLVNPGGVLIMEELSEGATNLSLNDPAALAWVKGFQTQYILQKTSLNTAKMLLSHFDQAQAIPLIGKFDSSEKKVVLTDGVKIIIDFLHTHKIHDDLNPMVIFGYQAEDWIKDAEELRLNPNFTFEINPLAVILNV